MFPVRSNASGNLRSVPEHYVYASVASFGADEALSSRPSQLNVLEFDKFAARSRSRLELALHCRQSRPPQSMCH